MKILVLTQIYPEPDDRDGYKPTKTVEYFAREWTALGHEVMVIHCQTKFPRIYYRIPSCVTNTVFRDSYALIPTFSSRKELFRVENGVKVYRLPMMKIVPSSSFKKREMDRQVRRIADICNGSGFIPDIVAGHFLNPCLELTARLGREFHARTSFVFHNDCNEVAISKYGMKDYLKDISVFGGRSIIEAKEIRNVLKLDYMPFICYSGVPNEAVQNVDAICTKHKDEERVNFLYVGGLLLKKHVDSVIKAFSKVYREGYRLTVVGGGAEENSLKELANKLGIKDAVAFTGRLPRDEVMAQMQRADIFAMISEHETFGMVYLEAMLQGCVVIASVGGGFDGIIKNGENGYLCDAGDEEKLARILEGILELPRARWNDIGSAAIETAKHFSEKDVAEHYLQEITGDRTAV